MPEVYAVIKTDKSCMFFTNDTNFTYNFRCFSPKIVVFSADSGQCIDYIVVERYLNISFNALSNSYKIKIVIKCISLHRRRLLRQTYCLTFFRKCIPSNHYF